MMVFVQPVFYNLLAKCWLNLDNYKTKPLIYNNLNTLKLVINKFQVYGIWKYVISMS